MSTRFTQGGAGAVTASTLTAGVVEIATNAEAQAGVSTDKVITPYHLATYSGSVTGALVYRGAYDASTSLPDISNASKGDFYVISADGSIDGVAVKIGDHIVFKQDAGGTLNAGDFDVVDNSESTDILRDADIGTDIQAHATVLDSLSGLALTPGDLVQATAASTLSAVPSTNFQASSSTLTDLGSLTTPAVDSVVQFTALGTLNLIDQTTLSGANALDDLSDVALTNPAQNDFLVKGATDFENQNPTQVKTTLGLTIGADVQAYDATLDALSALALSSGDLIKATGANTLTAVPSTDFQLSSSTLTDLGSLTTPAVDSVVQFTALGTLNLIDQSTLGGSTTGALIYQGSATVSGATTPPAEITGASKGDFFVVSGEGYYTGATSKFLRDGDHIVFNQDVGGSLTAAKFDVIDNTGLFDKVDQYSGTALSLQPRRVYTYSSIPNGATTFTLPDSSSLVSGDMIKLAWANTSQNSQHELSVTFAGGLGKPGLEHRAYGTSTTFNANTAGVTAVIKTRGQSITLIYDDVLDKFMVEMGTRFLGQLLDLDLDTSVPASGEFLKYDGTNWISEQIASGDVSGLGTAATSAATDFLAVANNLSDLGDAATARTNLNLGTAATAAATDFLSGTGADTLGGDLDVGSSSIVSSANADIALSPNGTGQILLDGDGTTANGGVSIENGLVDIKNAGSVSQLKLYCESSNAHAVTLQSAADASYTGGSYSLTLPGALPGSAQYLKTDTSGNLSWDTPAGGGGSFPLITTIQNGFTVGGTGDTTSPTAIGGTELERIYLVTTTAAATVVLPDASTVNAGFKLQIKRMGGHNVTLDPSTGTIDTQQQQVLSTQFASFTLVSDGSTTDWHII